MRLLNRLRRLFRLGAIDSELAEEMEFHLALKRRELTEGGLSEREAAVEVMRAMGNMTNSREDARGVWLPVWIESVWRDAVYAMRSLRREPGFAVVAIGTLTAAIGLNSSAFTVFEAAALRPWAVRDPARVVNVHALANHAPAGAKSATGFSIAEARFLNSNSQTFEGLAATQHSTVRIDSPDKSGKPSNAAIVTGNYFQVLGVNMERGRGFLREEDVAAGAAAVAVLSHAAWQNRFAGAPGIAGKQIHLDNVPFTVVGVAPPEFAGTAPVRTEVWVPFAALRLLRPLDTSVPDLLERPDFCCSDVTGRLRANMSRAQARAELEVLNRRFQTTKAGEQNTILLTDTGLLSHPGSKGKIAAALSLMFAGAFLILLMACANVGNLLIARAAARGREIATRLSIGASRARIVRQLLTESLVLASASGLLGLGVAYVLPPYILAHAINAEANLRLEPDWSVLAFSLALAAIAAVVFGLAPALHATRASGSRLRLRSVLLGVQVALSVILLVAAGLMLRGVQNASQRDPGFTVDNVRVVSFDLPANAYNPARVGALVAGLDDGLADAQIKATYGWARTAPFANGHWWVSFRLRGENATRDRLIETQEVAGDYFGTLGIPILYGRGFEPSDAGRGVVVVNETLAGRYLGDKNALGQSITTGKEVREVVGVVKDTYSVGLDSIEPLLYMQASHREMPQLLVRSSTPDSMQAVTAIAKRLDPRIEVHAEPLRGQLERHLSPARTASALAAALGLLALTLASIGMFGVFAYTVRQRTHEIGIRMALGARPGQVLRLVLGASSRPIVAGLLSGVVISGVVSRVIQRFLFGVSGFDLIAYCSVCLLLAAAALAASWLPARRAMRVEPVRALRYE